MQPITIIIAVMNLILTIILFVWLVAEEYKEVRVPVAFATVWSAIVTAVLFHNIYVLGSFN